MRRIPVISEQEFTAAKVAVKTALQLVTPLVQYAPSTPAMQHASPAKVAAAAQSVAQLADLVHELYAKHTETVKAAQALADAVKLAEDGLIDVADILEHAGHIPEVKVAAIGRLVREQDEAAPAEHQARGTDALTAFLRRQ